MEELVIGGKGAQAADRLADGVQGIDERDPQRAVADLSQEQIQRRPILGGLISEYERAA